MPAHSSQRLDGVVLAGGRSRRFGRDKALVGFGTDPDRSTLLASAHAKVSAAIGSPALVADRRRQLLPGVRSVDDGPGRGPAAGILGAAAIDRSATLLVLACDLPFVSGDLLAALLEISGDVVMPRWKQRWTPRSPHREADIAAPEEPSARMYRYEPLCAVYRPTALRVLADQVADNDFALHSLLASALEISFLEDAHLVDFGPPEELFLNINRLSDFDRASALRARRRLAQGTANR